MGIGRREFLRLFGGTLATLAHRASPAIVLIEDIYLNRKLGIAFSKPAGWHFGDVRQMGEIKQGQLLDLECTGLAQTIIDAAELPVLTISRDPLSAESRYFTPAVNVYLDRLDDSAEISLNTIIAKNIEQDLVECASILKEFNLTVPPSSTLVSDCPAVEYSTSFLFEHKQLSPSVRVRMRSLYLAQNPTTYTLRMYDSPYSSENDTFSYDSFVQSIRIV